MLGLIKSIVLKYLNKVKEKEIRNNITLKGHNYKFNRYSTVAYADGSNKKRLTSVEGWQSDHDPSWSSDSKYIVFERFEGQRAWYDIGNGKVLLENLHELTPWNNYLVDLEGNLTKLTDLPNGDIAFLPVYNKNKNSIMYIYMDFIKQDGKVIGADKKLMLLDLSSFEEVQFMPDNEHRYTLEYFDW